MKRQKKSDGRGNVSLPAKNFIKAPFRRGITDYTLEFVLCTNILLW